MNIKVGVAPHLDIPDPIVNTDIIKIGAVYAVDLHPQLQDRAASGGGDDKAFVWSVRDGTRIYETKQHSDSVLSVKFSPDGQYLATAGMDGVVHISNAETGELVNTLEGPDEINWIDWHPKGHLLIAGSLDTNVWMWNGKFYCL